ncbi:MAG TPA: hypothetical protein VM324_13215 [Egibacteraceae bacterium]|nr:hypothetical protein [Egibacteraceae bacterium]
MMRPLADNALTIARIIGQGRIAVGAAALLGPATVTRRWLKAGDPAPDAATAWRVAGARDLVLGLGTVLAARRSSPALRGWLEASALADAMDVYAFARDQAFRPLLRLGAILAAAASAGAGVWAARQVGR